MDSYNLESNKRLKLNIINKPVINSFKIFKYRTTEDTYSIKLPLDYDVEDIQVFINKLNYTSDIDKIKDKILYMKTLIPKDTDVIISGINQKDILLSDQRLTKEDLDILHKEYFSLSNKVKSNEEEINNIKQDLSDKIKKEIENIQKELEGIDPKEFHNEINYINTSIQNLKKLYSDLQNNLLNLNTNKSLNEIQDLNNRLNDLNLKITLLSNGYNPTDKNLDLLKNINVDNIINKVHEAYFPLILSMNSRITNLEKLLLKGTVNESN